MTEVVYQEDGLQDNNVDQAEVDEEPAAGKE
jgi:hypothetical protein